MYHPNETNEPTELVVVYCEHCEEEFTKEPEDIARLYNIVTGDMDWPECPRCRRSDGTSYGSTNWDD